MNTIIRMFLMACWTILCISTSLIVRLVTFTDKYAVWMARGIWAPVALKIAGVRLIIKGKEHIQNAPYIVVANHASFIDIPCLFYTMPFNLYFVAKKELIKMPFIGWYLYWMNMVFIDRSDKQKAAKSLADAADLIKKGKSVMTFPEGTRSKSDEINKFKVGAFKIALASGVPVLPVKIIGARAIWPAEKVKLTSGTITIVIGKPIDSLKYNVNQLADFTNATETIVRNLF